METLFKPDPELVFFIFTRNTCTYKLFASSILGFTRTARLDVLAMFSLLLYRANISFWPFVSGNYDGPLAEFARSPVNGKMALLCL